MSSPTERMRDQLKFMTREFTSYDFPDIHDACKILYDLKEKSEIAYVGLKFNSKLKRYVKTYKVIRISEKKIAPPDRVKLAKKRPAMPAHVKIWETIYPEYFTAPEFKIVNGVTKFRQNWF